MDPYSKNGDIHEVDGEKVRFPGVKCDGSGEENITQYWAVKDLGERCGICLEFNQLDKVNDL